MKKYGIYIPLHTSMYVEVEAENETQVIDIVEAMDYDMDQLLDNLSDDGMEITIINEEKYNGYEN